MADLETLVAKDQIVDTLVQLFCATDARDWAAEAFCYAVATHYLPNPAGRNVRTFVGSYDFQLRKSDRWRISLFRFNLKYLDGNLDLEKSAS